MKLPLEIDQVIDRQSYPLLFVTVSGAHLYGFESPDSDFDLRGVHCLPVPELVGLEVGEDTISATTLENGWEMDLVTHEAKKFFSMLLSRNGYVMEQLFSPLVLRHTPYLDELREIAKGCITRHHAHHYLGFAKTQWELFKKDASPRVKPLLYTYRVLLTGIHLMRTGVVEANLGVLNAESKLAYLSDLMTLKRTGKEKGVMEKFDSAFHEGEYQRLRAELETAFQSSQLPDQPSGRAQLHDLLLRIRLGKSHG